MFGRVILCLIVIPMGGDDTTLSSVVSGDKDEPLYSFSSRWDAQEVGQRRWWTVSNTITNHVPGARLLFSLPNDERGSVPAAVKKVNGELAPSARTMIRTTYRPVRQLLDGVSGAVTGEEGDFSFPSGCWTEAEKTVAAFPGAKLATKLLDGDLKGKELVRVVSEVTRDKAKGYTYSYEVKNLSDRVVHFRWGGMRQNLEPKKSFRKEEVSDKLTHEKSELMTIDIDGGEATMVMKANLWAPPK